MSQIYLDCDGVLADFEAGALAVLGMKAQDFQGLHGKGAFWKKLANTKDFYAGLMLLPDALELVKAVEHLDPIILTGVPVGQWAGPQKEAWGKQHFPHLRLITTTARDKSKYCEPGDVLVDDREQYAADWEAAGGHFILHTSARESLAQLRKLGLI